jgi:hypothetical protein
MLDVEHWGLNAALTLLGGLATVAASYVSHS